MVQAGGSWPVAGGCRSRPRGRYHARLAAVFSFMIVWNISTPLRFSYGPTGEKQMNRRWERLALIGAAIIIAASAIFYIYVDRFPSTSSTRIEDTNVNADGVRTIDKEPPSAAGDKDNPS